MCTKLDVPNQKDSVFILFTRFNNNVECLTSTFDLENQKVSSSYHKKYYVDQFLGS